ncbi:aspartate 1-decarboxylase [Thiotrichales bacterium 19S9-12]|nr:aspartate 1-decarboxylase [Thiotrichales bacterium 19S9-11]MCF6812277.1 aspartate 1-decarboxylase [Thiotrichales bacterium 19S9-12]
MLIHTLKSKISYATVTQKDLYYVGSITIDEDLMDQAQISENEKVSIVNLNNGERLETYVIKGKRGSKVIGLNGPAARKCELGDQIFILSYALIDPKNEKLEPLLVDLKH